MMKSITTKSMMSLAFLLSVPLVPWGQPGMAQSYLVSGTAEAPLRGAYEVTLTATPGIANGFLENDLQVTFTRDDGTQVTTSGFYDGGNTFKARAYLDSVGDWSWTSSSANTGLDGGSGLFTVVDNVNLPGKLRQSTEDSRQFVQDNGQWFLHLGDTGYRYINSAEPHWQSYIDQAAGTGFTKVRTWFGNPGGGVNGEISYMFQAGSLNLEELQAADQRLTYALNNHPGLQMQVIPFGEDSNKLLAYANNDPLVRAYAREVQARYGALPNVQWCLSNDRHLASDTTLRNAVGTLGTDWDASDAWNTLITNHQAREEPYSFVGAPWSDIVTFEHIDQVTGAAILGYRSSGAQDPIVNDEDRYESWRNPVHDRYFFRRLMWGSLLSGGAATYDGGQTWRPFISTSRWEGVQGYDDLNSAGLLQGGADDFRFIQKFFDDTSLTLIGLTPDDALVGSNAKNFKAIRDDNVLIAYLANPTGTTPETDNASSQAPAVTIAPSLNYGNWFGDWFNPITGFWSPLDELDNANRTFTAPGGGDWLLLISEQDIAPDDPGPPPPRQLVWDGGGSGDLWTTARNWNPDGVPTSIDNVQINAGSALIVDNVNATVLNTDLLRVPTDGVDTPVLTMTGGTLTNLGLRTEKFPVMVGSKGTGSTGDVATFNLSGGAVVSPGFLISNSHGTEGVVNMSGGSIDARKTGPLLGAFWEDFAVGDAGTGTLNMSGGTIQANHLMVPARDGTGTLNMTGGTIGLTDGIVVGQGIIHLDGGTITGTDLAMDNAGSMDITEGVLLLNTDAFSDIQNFETAGLITAYDGAGTLHYNYHTTNPGQTTVWATLGAAEDADFDNDGDVDGNDFLVWQRGFGSQYNTGDLAEWENHFSESVGITAAAATVPETATAMLALLGFGLFAASQRRPWEV